MTRATAFAAILIAFVIPSGAFAWTSIQSNTHGSALAVALFANGDAVTTQSIYGPSPEPSDLAIVRLDGVTGNVVWRYEQDLPGSDDASQVAVDGAGDVITANVRKATLMKLRGTDGALLWQTTVPGSINAFAVDARGDVFTGGALYTGPRYNETFSKVSGSDGSLVWSVLGPASSVKALAVDAQGDLFTASLDSRGLNGATSSVLRRISGAGAFQIWEAPIPGADTINEAPVTAQLDGSGHFVAVLSGVVRNESPKFAAPRDTDLSWWAGVAVDADSGKLLWRTEIHDANGTDGSGLFATAMAIAPDGTVYVSGGFGTQSNVTRESFSVVALDGVTGAERWRSLLGGGSLRTSRANDVAVAPDGSVVATGSTYSKTDDSSLFVTRLRARDGHPLWEKYVGTVGTGTSDQGEALALDAAGRISVAGTLYVPFVSTCPAAVKFDLNGASF
jgi:hypothetical protein